jgi:hypothetical protein
MSGPAEHTARSDDAAAYVLGALEGHEASEFRAHISSCELCAKEVDRLSSAAALLPLAAPQIQPPEGLRRRVVQGAARELRAGASPAGRRRFRLGRLELVGGGALAVGLLVGALVLGQDAPGTSVIRARVAAASVWHASVTPRAWLERYGDSAELVVADLPQPPRGKVYELWVERDGRPRSTDALFEPNSRGGAEAAVPGGVEGASAVLVTAERRGGARVPTMAPLIDASLQD